MPPVPEICKFGEFLNNNLKGNQKYLTHRSEYLVPAGENYGSIVLAINVQIEEGGIIRELKLVAKLCPPSDILREAFLTSITFIKEAKSYQDAHPLLEEFENKYNIPVQARLDVFAKCYGARVNLNGSEVVDDDAVILLENLKLQGFGLEDRFVGMNFDTSELLIKKLARLHASYVAIRLKKPLEFNNFMLPSLKSINNGGVMVPGFINTALHFAKTINECEKYLPQLIKMLEWRKLFNGLRFPVESNKNFYTIVHTDLWTNNIMILKDDSGKACKVKIVDLQLLDYGSPIRDLIFFLFTSVQSEICQKQFDYFLRFYHKHFVECLQDYKCSLEEYSWENFIREVNYVAPHELFHIIFMLKPIFSERGTIENLNYLKIEDFGRLDNMNDIYINKLKETILSFGERNWI